MSTAHPEGTRNEQLIEARAFALAASGLLILLGVVSLLEGWQLVGVQGWVWFVLAVPEIVLAVVLVAVLIIYPIFRWHGPGPFRRGGA